MILNSCVSSRLSAPTESLVIGKTGFALFRHTNLINDDVAWKSVVKHHVGRRCRILPEENRHIDQATKQG